MNLRDAQVIADDCMNGNGYRYSSDELKEADAALWSVAGRVDYNRLTAVGDALAVNREMAGKRLSAK